MERINKIARIERDPNTISTNHSIIESNVLSSCNLLISKKLSIT
jgi:hypothetical protein